MNRNSQRLIARMSSFLLLSAVLMPSLVGSVQATEKKISLESNEQSDVSQSSKQDLKIGNPNDPNTNSQDSNVENTDNVDEKVDLYMQQAGLPKRSELGKEIWVDACDIQVQQGAGTVNSGRTEVCPFQYSVPGWQMLEWKAEVLENKYNRGSYTGGVIEKDGNFKLNEQEIGDKWKVATDNAVKAKEIEVKKKLDLEYQRHQELIRNYASNKNTFFLKVTANGGAFRKSVIRVKAKVRLVRIG